MSPQKRTFKLKPLAAAIAFALAAPASVQLAHANGQGLGMPGLKVDGTPVTTYYVNSELPRVVGSGANRTVSGGIRKFQDGVANLTAQNNLNQILPIGVPNSPYTSLIAAAQATDPTATVPYPGSDYYEIGIVDYREQLASDLPKVTGGNGAPSTGGTHLRGYVQLVPANWTGTDVAGHALTAVPLFHIDGTPITADGSALISATNPQLYGATNPHYLGPVIVATKGTPVRVKYSNLLPTGTSGNALLPIPVDETYVGAGVGPDGINLFQQNRAELHLHGGVTPWISDGTPHQWTVPVGDGAVYQKGASFQNVPDMPDPGQGSGTLYWTNDQSARLMFYHDHTSGTTRLNVYNGEAAGYVLLDKAGTGEHTLPIPGTGSHVLDQIPLVIQDRTFVPTDIEAQDPLWNHDAAGNAVAPAVTGRGVVGDLWFPHVYETNQDPASPDGTNPVGRWDWAPYFWPVFPSMFALPTGAVGDVTGTPEAFVDTPLVNGTVYPYLAVEPKAYRFRVLVAGNDRFLNLGFYVAEPLSIGLADAGIGYTSVPTVQFAAGAGDTSGNAARAAATAVIGVTDIPNPVVTGVPVAGSPPPADVFTVPPTVTVSAPGGGGIVATAVATLQVPGAGQPAGTPTSLNSILLSNPGSGYTAPPTVTITPAAVDAARFAYAYGGATATVTASIGLAGITITNDGTNGGASPWTIAPTVTLVGGGATTPGVAVASVNTEPHLVNFDASYVPPATLSPNGHAGFPTTGGLMGTGWGFADARVGGVPDPATAGPDIIQIGSEGGLLPAPVVIPSTPINYEYNKRSVTVLNTLEHGLFLGPAERADIVVDFSKYAGKTLILYNDAPAPLPAGDPRLDYYTGDADQTASGGAPTTLPGYGPNTRTIMQIRVGTSITPGSIGYPQLGDGSIDTSGLAPALAAAYAGTQDPPIVAEPAYNAAFPAAAISNPQYLGIMAGSLQQPNFTFTQGNGLTGGLNSVQVTTGGSGYLVAPQVSIVDNAVAPAVPGSGAIATATLKVSSIAVTTPGSGYTGAPAVTFVNNGPSGTGVTAAATLRLGTVNGTVVAVGSIIDLGGNYTVAPTLAFSAPPQGSGGSKPTATVALGAAGNVLVTITGLGSGYTVTPTMALSGGTKTVAAAALSTTASVDSVKVTAPNPTTTGGGMGYTDLTRLLVTLAAPTAAGGVTARAAVNGGSVDAITLVNPGSGYNVATTQVVFAPVNGGSGAVATASSIGGLPILNKAIQELFEPIYGRMNATLGVELPLTTATTQTTIPLAYVDPTTETLPLGETQIWKITHNGVDSHPVHFHLVNVQLINRVGWDGTVKPPHDNELGWKETVRMNPLEDVYVAVRARMPQMIGTTGSGFGTPASYRYLDPSQQPGGTLGFTMLNPQTGVAVAQTNDQEDFDNEYVWHCHILGHEENDFMRPFVFNPPVGVQPNPALPAGSSAAPTALSGTAGVQANNNPQITVTWTDNAWNEIRYDVYRAVLPAAAAAAPAVGDPSYSFVGSTLANGTRYVDTNVSGGTNYAYYVAAVSARKSAPVAPYTSAPVQATAPSATGVFVGVAPGTPVAPSGLALSAPVWDSATASFKTTASWLDKSLNELGFELENAAAGGVMAPVVAPLSNAPLYDLPANATSNSNTGLAEATQYNYQVAAVNASGASAFVTASVSTPAAPAWVPSVAPATGVSATTATVNWTNGTVGKQTRVTVSAASATPGAVIPAAQTLAAGSTAAAFVGLTQNASYVFTITSINAPAGPLAVAAATASTSTTVQTGYAAAGTASVTASALSAASISLTLADAGPVSGYTIVRAAAGGTPAATYYVAAAGASTQWTDPAVLAQATTYAYSVTPFNGPFTAGVAPVANAATGANNGAAVSASATTNYATSGGMVTLTGSGTTPTQVTLQFVSGTPVTGYVVTRSGGAAFAPVWVAAPATQYIDNTAVAATTYTYTVTPWNASLAAGMPTTATVALGNGTTIAGGNSGTPVLSAPVTTPVSSLAATVASVATQTSITLTLGTTSGTATSFVVTSCLAGPTAGSCAGPVTTQTVAAAAGKATVAFSGLQAGTAYNFTAAAAAGGVTGTPVAATATTLAGVAVTAPVNLAATMRAVTPRIQLTWTDPGTNITQYVVERSVDGVTYSQLGTVAVGAVGSLRTYNDTAVVLGNTYWYRVKAENIGATGVASPSAYTYIGPEVFAVPATPAAAPTVGARTATTAALSWAAVPGATGYQLYANGVAQGAPVTTTSATGATPATNTNYVFTVAAINTLGTGGQSPGVTVLTAPGTVGAPNAVRGAAGSRAATVTWAAPTGNGTITAYAVTAQQRIGFTWTNVTVGIAVNTATRTAAITGLTVNATYRFQITATNAGGTGPAAVTGTIVAR